MDLAQAEAREEGAAGADAVNDRRHLRALPDETLDHGTANKTACPEHDILRVGPLVGPGSGIRLVQTTHREITS